MASDTAVTRQATTVLVDHSLFAVFDYSSDARTTDLVIPQESNWKFVAGYGGALFHASDRALQANVTVEVFDRAPSQSTLDSEDGPDQLFHSPTGEVLIACITGSPADKTVNLPSAGEYTMRACRVETRTISDADEAEMYEEDWLIHIWPAGQ